MAQVIFRSESSLERALCPAESLSCPKPHVQTDAMHAYFTGG